MITDALRRDLLALMDQVPNDLQSAHAELMKAQGADPAKYTWPEWSPQANTLRWIPQLRARLVAATEGRTAGELPAHEVRDGRVLLSVDDFAALCGAAGFLAHPAAPKPCGILTAWQYFGGAVPESYERYCNDPATLVVPAHRTFDPDQGDCPLCLEHQEGDPGTLLADPTKDAFKLCRICGHWDTTTDGHGYGECQAEHVPEHPDV